MSEQTHKQKSSSKQPQAEQTDEGLSQESKDRVDSVQEQSQATVDDIDALLSEENTDDLLDEIDSLLPETEAEAEAFVNAFVQKGGE